MRIVMQMRWDGVTPEQYEHMRNTAHWEPDVPKGAVFHVPGFHDNAIRVTDIWGIRRRFKQLCPGPSYACGHGCRSERTTACGTIFSTRNFYPGVAAVKLSERV